MTHQLNIQTDIIRLVEFCIDNIFVEFDGHVYQQTAGIPMGINCAPLVADLFLYSYEADFVHLQKTQVQEEKTSFNLTVHYIDDVLSLNNPKFNDYVDVIYPKELEIKDATAAPIYGLIILTFIWSLMRMVNRSHDSMTSAMTLISL